jgi:2,5-diketo-D-gluconate reductase A
MTATPWGPFTKHAWRIGFGTYRLAASETESVVSQALNLGWRHIDTAALYRNEAAVGAALRASGVPRRELFVTTKIHVADIANLDIAGAVERALKHLGEIDLILLHGWRPQAPEAWNLLIEQARAGRVRAIGVSNFGADDIAALQSSVPTVNQIEMSPLLQRLNLRAAMTAAGITTVAHSPLIKARRMDVIEHLTNGLPSPAHTPAQMLLAWSMARGAIPLVRSRNEFHMRDNLAAPIWN